MKKLIFFVLLTTCTTNILHAQDDEDTSTAEQRTALLYSAKIAMENKSFSQAAEHYYWGVNNWDSILHAKDHLEACKGFFDILYSISQHTVKKHMLTGCDKRYLERWYSQD